jgi:hypothetical protein
VQICIHSPYCYLTHVAAAAAVLHITCNQQAAASSGKAELPQQLVRSAYDALVAARDDSARLAKELTELKNSRVQLIPPSAWVKREHKYKMDQEKYEHTVSMLQQRIERLELELQVLREGSNVKPLEQRIEVSSSRQQQRIVQQCLMTSATAVNSNDMHWHGLRICSR